MKQYFKHLGKIFILIIFIYMHACAEKQLKVSSFCESLTPVSRILEDPEWTSWDMAPIYDESGKIHLYVGRWPKDGDWPALTRIIR